MQICSIDVTEDYMYGSVASVLVEDIDTDELEYYYEVDGEKKIDDYTVCLKNTKRFGTNIDFENVKSAVLKPFDWQGYKESRITYGRSYIIQNACKRFYGACLIKSSISWNIHGHHGKNTIFD